MLASQTNSWPILWPQQSVLLQPESTQPKKKKKCGPMIKPKIQQTLFRYSLHVSHCTFSFHVFLSPVSWGRAFVSNHLMHWPKCHLEAHMFCFSCHTPNTKRWVWNKRVHPQFNTHLKYFGGFQNHSRPASTCLLYISIWFKIGELNFFFKHCFLICKVCMYQL